MNPYWNKSVLGFFQVLMHRLWQWMQGDLPMAQLVSDEVQILVLSMVAVAGSLVGTLLVLKKMAMLANSLSHTILVGVVAAYLLTLPFVPAEERHMHAMGIDIKILLLAALASALLTTLLTQFFIHVIRLQEDASIGFVFTTLFALGIILVTVFTRNTHIGVEAVMGNVDALHIDDFKLMGRIALLDLAFILLFFKEFKLTAFDCGFAASSGLWVRFLDYLLMVLVAATVVGAFRAVGVLLVLSFLVAPPLMARLLTHRLPVLITLACALGTGCSILGVALARHILSVYDVALSTAGLVVTLMALAYLILILLTGVVKKWRRIHKLHETVNI